MAAIQYKKETCGGFKLNTKYIPHADIGDIELMAATMHQPNVSVLNYRFLSKSIAGGDAEGTCISIFCAIAFFSRHFAAPGRVRVTEFTAGDVVTRTDLARSCQPGG
jgi:hypothetical protein